jgi:hypothetical protein
MERFFAVFAGILCATGCASPEVRFSSDEPVQVELRTLEAPYEGGEVVGATPQTLPLEKVMGKVVRLSGAGREPQYWLFSPPTGAMAEIKVKLSPAAEAKAGAGSPEGARVDPNVAPRLLMKACGALHAADYALAREFAGKASDIAPTLAAPYIVVGLSFLQEGQKEQAKLALSKAKALDPSDQEVAGLLMLTQ